MISFQTPKLPSPLDLDLVQLSGGGSYPSQFYGKTHDDRDVYVRYRGGFLSVRVGDDPGDDAVRGSAILEADVGPPFDGTMSLTQFCRYFGVTVNGAIPEESDTDAHLYNDLSGAITHCRAYLDRVTLATSNKILRICVDSFPDAILVKAVVDDEYRCTELIEVTIDDVADYGVWLVDGVSSPSEIKSSPRQYVVSTKGQLQIGLNFDLWRRPEPVYTSTVRDRACEELGRDLIEAGMRGMPEGQELAYSTFRISSQFSSSDKLPRMLLSRLGEALEPLLPVTQLERVDLRTGQVVSTLGRPFDPAMLEWFKGGPDRWISISRDGREGPWIGVRPSVL